MIQTEGFTTDADATAAASVGRVTPAIPTLFTFNVVHPILPRKKNKSSLTVLELNPKRAAVMDDPAH